MTQRLTADDFFTGLFAALALKGRKIISLRDERFDRTIGGIFDTLEGRATQEHLDVLFYIAVHPVHGDSPTVRHSISDAAQRGVISFDNPEYQNIRLRLDPQGAATILDSIPGGRPLFEDLADEFIRRYDLVAS